MARAGRPTKYHTNVEPNLNKISKWKQDGWREEDIAKALNVAYSTFMEYKKLYPELVEVLKEENEYIIAKSVRTLMQMAWGINPDPTIIDEEYELNRRTGKMELIKKKVRYDTKPNITSLLFLLKNKSPNDWQDRRGVITNDGEFNEEVTKNIKLLQSIMTGEDVKDE